MSKFVYTESILIRITVSGDMQHAPANLSMSGTRPRLSCNQLQFLPKYPRKLRMQCEFIRTAPRGA
eukprot:6210455-Pleurochrysis_carterae.AAC.3